MAELEDEALDAGIALDRAMTRIALEHAKTPTALAQSTTHTGLIRRRPA